MIARLEARLAAMLGERAGVGSDPVTDAEGLSPVEAAAVARAVAGRQAEFAAGRRAARTALSRIGVTAGDLPVGPGRAPVWPEGTVGAITHDAAVALAAVARAGDVRGIGIDLTEAAPLPGDTVRAILPHAEEQELTPLEARAVFSAKESLFKALYPLSETYFGFDAALVRPDLEAGVFTVSLVTRVGNFPPGQHWSGKLGICGPHLMSSLILPLAGKA